MINSVVQRVREAVEAWFAPREILIRSHGRVKYLRLSTRGQLLGASMMVGMTSVAFATSVAWIAQQFTSPGKDLANQQTARVYTGLLAEVNDYFDQFRNGAGQASPAGDSVVDASADVASLGNGQVTDVAMQIAAPDSAIVPAAPDKRDDSRRKLRLALQQKLRTSDSDMQQITERNQSLHDQVAGLTETVQTLRQSADRLEKQNADLTAEAASREMEKTQLAAKVQVLNDQLAGEQRDRQAAVAENAELTAKIEGLRAQIDDVDLDKGGLAQQIAQNERALSTLIAQRNALQTDRADMSQSIAGLKERLVSLQETQADFASSLAERARSNMVEMEKTVAMTGLNVDKLLHSADESTSGQGGPFIPAPSATSDENEQKLAMSVATLGDEVGRWEKLQVVLHSLPLTAPIDHYYISSGFGERVDPINGEKAIHEGVDMVGALRSEILATAPGKVIFAGWQSGYGQVVELDHGFGVHTFYAHLDSIQVKKGQNVDYRDVLGRLGTTGRSSGPHIHYEVRYDTKPLDPMGFLKAGRYVFKG
ncbi:MAG: peptidoglycan DD-metalloendopeptidase family protein [Dongiaceae bacterium]